MKSGACVLWSLCMVLYTTITVPYRAPMTTIWLQTIDSCRQAIPGASWILEGNGIHEEKGPAPGTKPRKVGNGNCPIQRGNCKNVPTGCLSWDISTPSTTRTYTITETQAPANYVPCNGGSVCSGGPEIATLTVDSNGHVAATTFNVYPDGKSVIYPTSGDPYTGSITDPIVTHNFELGNGWCDKAGDNGIRDDDDHLTGGVGSHCDADKDRTK